MTDIHSHLLYNIDDGSHSVEESVELLIKLKEIGFNNVILTPHYIQDSEYSADNKEKKEKFEYLKETLNLNKIDINIFLGNEIFYNNNIVELVKTGYITPLNNTNYLLIELPFHNKILNLEDMLYEIKCKGYIPIIAHPERYTYFHDNYDLVDKLKEEDILFQCNYASIIGYYGKDSEKLFRYMLKNGYVDYLGTDLHSLNKTIVIDKFKKIEKEIRKVAGKEYYQEIQDNCDLLVE